MIPFDQLFWTGAVAVVCSSACAILGCFLVLRRLSMMGDAISHGILPGIAVGFLLSGQLTGWGLFLGAMAFGVLTAFLTQTIRSLARVPEDTGMGIVFTSLFALGVILIKSFSSHLDDCVFYGSLQRTYLPGNTFFLFGIEIPNVLPSMLLSLGLTIGFVTLFWKELRVVSFDPALATAMGINAALVHYLLMAMVSGVTVTSFSAIGSILVIAMLIVPGACGHMLSDRMSGMILWAVGVAVFSAVAGTLLTPAEGSVPGMMVMIAGLVFLLVVLFAPRHGVVARVIRNARFALRIRCEDILAGLYRHEEAAEAAAAVAVERASIERALTDRVAVWWLRRDGQIEFEPSGIRLTESGRVRAQSLVRAHRLWESYLDKNFDLPPDHLHEPATEMEHYIGPALQSELEAELETPAIDPHGRQIPPSPAADAEDGHSQSVTTD